MNDQPTQRRTGLLSKLTGSIFGNHSGNNHGDVIDLPCTFLGNDFLGATGDNSPEDQPPNRGPAPSMEFHKY